MNLLRRAAEAAEAFENRWLKEATNLELRSLCTDAREADSKTLDPVMVSQVRARVDTRRRLGLPPVDCTARKPGDCRCLTSALTEFQLFGKGLGDAGDAMPGLAKVTKKELLARSSAHHKETRRWLKPRQTKPKPIAAPLDQMPAEVAQSPPQPPQPSAEASEPPPSPKPRRRPVHRTSKWYDEDERRSILDYEF
jgi:hypothetical protein